MRSGTARLVGDLGAGPGGQKGRQQVGLSTLSLRGGQGRLSSPRERPSFSPATFNWEAHGRVEGRASHCPPSGRRFLY